MKVLIAGIGNVLLGDDGIGPYAIEVLKAQYDFPENVELADLGTPGLDLPVHLAGADAVILVECAEFGGGAGDIRLFRKKKILRIPPRTRIDLHSPALRESLSVLELIGAMPRELMIIGMQGNRFDQGSTLSTWVRHCIPHIVDAVRRELHRLNAGCVPKQRAKTPEVWWNVLWPKVKAVLR